MFIHPFLANVTRTHGLCKFTFAKLLHRMAEFPSENYIPPPKINLSGCRALCMIRSLTSSLYRNRLSITPMLRYSSKLHPSKKVAEQEVDVWTITYLTIQKRSLLMRSGILLLWRQVLLQFTLDRGL